MVKLEGQTRRAERKLSVHVRKWEFLSQREKWIMCQKSVEAEIWPDLGRRVNWEDSLGNALTVKRTKSYNKLIKSNFIIWTCRRILSKKNYQSLVTPSSGQIFLNLDLCAHCHSLWGCSGYGCGKRYLPACRMVAWSQFRTIHNLPAVVLGNSDWGTTWDRLAFLLRRRKKVPYLETYLSITDFMNRWLYIKNPKKWHAWKPLPSDFHIFYGTRTLFLLYSLSPVHWALIQSPVLHNWIDGLSAHRLHCTNISALFPATAFTSNCSTNIQLNYYAIPPNWPPKPALAAAATLVSPRPHLLHSNNWNH